MRRAGEVPKHDPLVSGPYLQSRFDGTHSYRNPLAAVVPTGSGNPTPKGDRRPLSVVRREVDSGVETKRDESRRHHASVPSD